MEARSTILDGGKEARDDEKRHEGQAKGRNTHDALYDEYSPGGTYPISRGGYHRSANRSPDCVFIPHVLQGPDAKV